MVSLLFLFKAAPIAAFRGRPISSAARSVHQRREQSGRPEWQEIFWEFNGREEWQSQGKKLHDIRLQVQPDGAAGIKGRKAAMGEWPEHEGDWLCCKKTALAWVLDDGEGLKGWSYGR